MRLDKTLITLTVASFCAASSPAQNQVSLTVDVTMDIYRAGNYNDGSDGITPVVFTFPARAWRTMTFPSVGGAWSCSYGVPEYSADGTTSGPCEIGNPPNFNSIGPFSGYHLTDFVGALVGIFLEDTLPTSPAPALRFYVSNNSDGGIQTDFLTLSPEVGQVFFIGDGLTGTSLGNIQTFHVPPTATHLYLGYVDHCAAPSNTVPGCYRDNVGSLNVVARLQQYIPDWVQPTLTTAPSARCCAAMAYDAAAFSTVLFGGGNYSSNNDTWIWRNGWTQLFPATSPPARYGPGAAYDPTTGTVVLFGGEDYSTGAVMNDTWTWDGVTWTQQFPSVSPPARVFDAQSMAYDAATGTVVLFGGQGGVFGDTWEWNGRTKTWKQDFPASSPSPRNTVLAYDALTREVVLFGGNGPTGPFLNDTWTWDGLTWTQRFPATSPSPRGAPAFVYDWSLGQVILFGGSPGPPQAYNDTWAWNGVTWTQLKVPAQPSARYAPNADFDPLSDGLLLFGGANAPANDTWLLVPVPLIR